MANRSLTPKIDPGGSPGRSFSLPMLLRVLALTVLCAAPHAWPPPAGADLVLTAEGDRLEGEVTAIGQGQLTLTGAGGTSTQELMDIDRVLFSDVLLPAAGSVELVNNDGKHDKRTTTGKIKLRAGMHRMVVAFVHGRGEAHLNLKIEGPQLNKQPLALRMVHHVPQETQPPPAPGLDDKGYRLPENPPNTKRRLAYAYYPAPDDAPDGFADTTDLSGREPGQVGTTNRVTPRVAPRDHDYGLVFTGYVDVKHDGQYIFYLTSTGGSRLYFGQGPYLTHGGESSEDAPWALRLSDGTALTGRLIRWDQEALTLSLDELTLNVPADYVRHVQSNHPKHRRHAADAARIAEDEDTLFVVDKNGQLQHVVGQTRGVEAGALLFSYQGQQRRIGLERVVSLHLPAAEPRRGVHFHQVLQLNSGPQLAGQWIGAGPDQLGFETSWGQRLDVPRSKVAQVQMRHGRLVRLTDIEPSRAEHTPYFDRVIPYCVDACPGGKPIQLSADRVVAHGLCTHSRTVLQYALNGRYRRFQTEVALQHLEAQLGNVDLRVRGDDRILHETLAMTHETPSALIDVDVSGVQHLILEVDFGAGQDVGDRVVWAEPRLIRAKTGAESP